MDTLLEIPIPSSSLAKEPGGRRNLAPDQKLPPGLGSLSCVSDISLTEQYLLKSRLSWCFHVVFFI